MVVKMKRLELLLYHKDREQFLEALRTLGVVHIVEHEQIASSHVQELTTVLRMADRIVHELKKIESAKHIEPSAQHSRNPEEILMRYEELQLRKEKINQELTLLQKDVNALRPWGDFDPDSLKQLDDQGVRVRFYAMPAKRFDALDRSELPIELIKRTEGTVYFVAVEYGESVQVPGAEEVRLPDVSLKEALDRMAELDAEKKNIETTVESMVGSIARLEKFISHRSDQLHFERARLSLDKQAEGKLLTLDGWVPEGKEKKLKEFLDCQIVYYTVRDPLPDEDVPVMLKNRPIPKLFEPITGLYALPLYNELDTTPFVAPFFAIFFGLALGDVGYGSLMFLAAFGALIKAPPSFKGFAKLGIVLSITTIISGVLLNSFFGQAIFGGPGVPDGTAFFETGAQVFAPLSMQETEAGPTFPAMSLALALGFIQVLFGMGLQAHVRMRYGGFIAGLQPISYMLMIIGMLIYGANIDFLQLGIHQFEVGPVKVGLFLVAIPKVVGQILLFGGFGVLLLFNNPRKRILVRPLLGLYETYNFITALLSDSLSYLRLFALGLGGALLGSAFNQIAFMFITAEDGSINYASVGIIGTVLVLVIGHSLNLALSALSAFVHPLRLTFVEFYKNVGFQGGSKPYIPFSRSES